MLSEYFIPKSTIELGFIDPRRLSGLPAVTPNKILLLRCIHHFQSDLMNNMDHMCKSGTKPSSMILSQTK